MRKRFRSDLSVAKGLGAGGGGAHHWWHLRFTSVFLAIIVIWFAFFCIEITDKELTEIINIVQKPQNIVMLSLFAIMSFHHSALGMQVIIEDYINHRLLKLVLILLIQMFSVITAISFLIAVMRIMNL